MDISRRWSVHVCVYLVVQINEIVSFGGDDDL